MTSISAAASGPSYFSQGEGSLPLHQSVGELVNWFASEIHSFMGTNGVCATIMVPTPAGINSQGPEPAHVNDHQSHPGGFTTSATAIITFTGHAVPTRITLSLVPLHLGIGTGQHPPSLNLSSPPSLDLGSEFSPFPPSELSEPSHLPVEYAITRDDITKDPRYLEYTPTPSGFPNTLRNSIPRPDERYDHQPPRHDDPKQEPIPNGTLAVVTASPGVAVCPPPFNPAPWAYLVPGHPLSSPPVNRQGGVMPPARATYQNEGNGQSTSQVDQTSCDQDTPPLLTQATNGPIRGVGVDQHPNRHKCTMCAASYVRPSALNRHVKDKHTARMACPRCSAEFSLGRMYKFAEHLETCPGA